MSNIMMVVFGMMIVTYIPRIIPFFMLSEKKLPKKLKIFLEFVPYTTLGALIIPGSINVLPDAPMAVTAGLGFAFIYSYLKGGIIVPVVGSIAAVYLMLSI